MNIVINTCIKLDRRLNPKIANSWFKHYVFGFRARSFHASRSILCQTQKDDAEVLLTPQEVSTIIYWIIEILQHIYKAFAEALTMISPPTSYYN